jgi:hypothetical protein
MIEHSAEFRRCLDTLDVATIRRLWKHVNPHLPQPANDEEALTRLHYARTLAQSMPFKKRAYSHSWLLERGLPSGLPDHMRKRADRMYPRVVEAVGIAVKGGSELGRLVAPLIQADMADAVRDIYAGNKTPDPAVVKKKILEARDKSVKQLLGRVR